MNTYTYMIAAPIALGNFFKKVVYFMSDKNFLVAATIQG